MFVQQVFNGLMLGGLYALLAVGFSLLFSVLRLINLAHGSVFMLGAFITTILIATARLPFLVAALAGMVFAGAVGLIVERLSVAPLRKRKMPFWYGMISTFAMALIFENLAFRIFGTNYRPFPSPFQVRVFTLFGATFTNLQIATLVASLGLMGLLVAFTRYTWLGRAFRAVSQDPATASLMGVNVNQTVALAFFISGSLAGAAGTLVAMSRNIVAVSMGLGVGMKGFISSALGGVGSIAGAALGGFILGMVEAMAAAYISANVKDIVSFAVLIAVLVWRPTGLLGRQSL
jgi:branched-chain amino acid transport system permease protein